MHHLNSRKESRGPSLHKKYIKYFFGAFIVVVLVALFFYFRNPQSDNSNTLSYADPQKLKNIDVIKLAKEKDSIKPIVQEFGIKAVMAELIEKSGGGSAFDCHQEAHSIGRAGYELVKEKAFAECNANCHSGCYHGAMETFLKDEGTTNIAANIDRVCKTFSSSFGIFECLHGVGHGVLAYLDYDMPEAIKECRKLSTNFAQSSCYGGMFMENVLTGQGLGANAKQKDHETPWVNRTDSLFPCDKVDSNEDVQYQCYQMQTSWMLYINNYNFDKVAAECRRAPKNMIPVCYKSFGRDAAGHTLRNPTKILDLCDKVPSEHYDRCIEGALNVIVDFWGPALKNQAAEFCSLAPSRGKDICYSTLAWRITDVFTDPTTQKARCDEFEASYKQLCEKK